jgi:hypothetical protein
MITYNWRIVKLEAYPSVNDKVNVVYAASWECNATEVVAGKSYAARAADMTYIKINLESFTEYQNLTEAQVLAWVFEVINKDHMEANIAEVLASEQRPIVVTLPLPWN